MSNYGMEKYALEIQDLKNMTRNTTIWVQNSLDVKRYARAAAYINLGISSARMDEGWRIYLEPKNMKNKAETIAKRKKAQQAYSSKMKKAGYRNKCILVHQDNIAEFDAAVLKLRKKWGEK